MSARSATLRVQDKASGGFVLLSALYGGLVTAFNPAPKNLKAAILAGGTATAWNVNLRPGERGRVYAQGHLAMACVVSAGTPLLSYQSESLDTLTKLRVGALKALNDADEALNANPEEASPAAKFRQAPPAKTLDAKVDQLVALMADQESAKARTDQRKALQALAKTLGELDAKLAEEQAAWDEAPFRVAKSRRDVEAAVAKLLQGAAPDYKAAAESIGKGLGDAAPSETAGAGGATPKAKAGGKFAAAHGTSGVSLDDGDSGRVPVDPQHPGDRAHPGGEGLQAHGRVRAQGRVRATAAGLA